MILLWKNCQVLQALFMGNIAYSSCLTILHHDLDCSPRPTLTCDVHEQEQDMRREGTRVVNIRWLSHCTKFKFSETDSNLLNRRFAGKMGSCPELHKRPQEVGRISVATGPWMLGEFN